MAKRKKRTKREAIETPVEESKGLSKRFLATLAALVAVTVIVFTVYRFFMERPEFYIVFGIYAVIAAVSVISYVIYNRGFSRSGITRDMLPDTMSEEQKDAFIKKNPAYGKIVCRCETVSEGEIRQAIRQNPPARDIDGVKRRTRSGMGRCQGGFCMPTVMRLIAEERGEPMEKITKNGGASTPLIGKL